MASASDIDELRRESEETREALAYTVSELRDRVGDSAAELKTLVSPTHIKQEFRDYVRQEGEGLVQALQRKAKENPLQVAAVGAAVAYPALGLLRAIRDWARRVVSSAHARPPFEDFALRGGEVEGCPERSSSWFCLPVIT